MKTAEIKISGVIYKGMVVLVFLVLVVTAGCGGDYLPEKYLYKARQMTQKLDLKVAGPVEYNEVINAYKIVTSRWPLSNMALAAHYDVAQLYALQNNYEKAREELEMIVVNFFRKKEQAADAQFAIGQLYEKEGNIDAAVKEYKILYDLYPLTEQGLKTPLYIAALYRKKNDIKGVENAYNEALLHYRKKTEELGDIKAAAVLYHYIAVTYATQGLWVDAVKQWELIPEKFSDSPLVPTTLLMLGEVYYSKMKERTKAMDSYKKLLELYPGTEIAQQGLVKLIQINFVTGDFEHARMFAEQLLEQYAGDNREVYVQAKTIIARSFEKEGDWDKAEAIYEDIMTHYSDTASALRIPLFRALHYKEEENLDEVNKIYETTLSEYEKIINHSESDQMKQSAQELTNLIYVQQENWNRIIDNMQKIIDSDEYKPEQKIQALFSIAYIYQDKLNKKNKAIETYQRFIQEFPKNPLTKNAQEQIELLKNSEK